ncbi:hypothetical protein [Methylacidimicrobium sp. B4]|uniref:hypothetical protein n=1 Tax=Methylacidimicrobium sp. B4 TaxID=2796139 RepID=UPI001A905B8A|nr:hypothetical protein [Methylacidimicrobium sp. B4]QSR85199.1 hypothetical protein MacB4_02750 [Methylacidimicrobium sp. B4]
MAMGTEAPLAKALSGLGALAEEHWGPLSSRAEELLRAAGRSGRAQPRAEALLREATEAEPGHISVLIGNYRYAFYSGKLMEARDWALACLEAVAKKAGLPQEWSRVGAPRREESARDDPLFRLYLFALKAYGYLESRLGEREKGLAALRKLEELDPMGLLRGGDLRRIVERGPMEDED